MATCTTHGHQNRKKQVPGLYFLRQGTKMHPERTPIASRIGRKNDPQMIAIYSRLWKLAGTPSSFSMHFEVKYAGRVRQFVLT